MTTLLRLLVLVPAAAALLGLLLARQVALARAVAVVGALGTLGIAAAVLVGQDPQTVGTARLIPALHLGIPGQDAGGLSIPFWQTASGPVVLIAFVVALVAGCVQVYTTWYLRDDDRYGVFAASVSLFSAAMLLVVTSSDLVLTLIGWEVMGWCSYLLIGHWSRKEAARRAAHKAFLVTRVADVGFVLGVVILAGGAGTTSYVQVSGYWAGCQDSASAQAACAAVDHRVLTLALVLLLVGILGKSAMVPFHDWLPDAMEGPTPASALIHAATMVAAGTFVLAQLFDVLAADDTARAVLGVSTAVTMVWGAVLAFGQSDLKRLLAYSTVSQVAIMLSAIAAAPPQDGPTAGTFHLYAHAFYKALLFLLIGWMSVLAGGTSAVRLRGVARRSVLLHVAFLLGLASLAGLPFIVGGLSKEHVIEAAYAGSRAGDATGTLVLAALLLTVVLTAAYATRAYLVVAAGPANPPTIQGHQPSSHPSGADDGAFAEARVIAEPGGEMPAHAGDDLLEHDGPGGRLPAAAATDAAGHDLGRPPVAVLGVVVVLLAGTVLGGLVLFTDLLPGTRSPSGAITAVTVLLVVIGALLAAIASISRAPHPAHALSRGRVDPAVRIVGKRMPLFDNGFGADTAYRVLVAQPVLALAHGVAHVDDRVVDATARLCARLVAWTGGLGVRAHSAERPSTGLVWVALGALVVGAVGVLGWR